MSTPIFCFKLPYRKVRPLIECMEGRMAIMVASLLYRRKLKEDGCYGKKEKKQDSP